MNECRARVAAKGDFCCSSWADESGNLCEIFVESCVRVHSTKVERYFPSHRKESSLCQCHRTPGRTAAQVVRLIGDLNGQLENDAIDPKTARARLYAPRTMLVAMKMRPTIEPLSRRRLRTPETGPLLEAVAEIPAPRDEPLRELTT